MSVNVERLSAIQRLASEAETFFDFEAWGAGDDVKEFERAMRDFLETDYLGPWAGNEELSNFKEQQAAAGITNREVLIGLWGARAFGHHCTHGPDCDLRREELASRYSPAERELVRALELGEQQNDIP